MNDLLTDFAASRAIEPSLMATAAEVVANQRSHETYEVLGWKEPSRNWQVRKPHDFRSLLVFRNEDGSTWQAKPERPRNDGRGKVVKYETPVGLGGRAYFPAVDAATRRKIAQVQGVNVPAEGSFWDWVAANPQLPKILTEGAGKALALLSHGFIGIALTGVNGGVQTHEKDQTGLRTRLQEARLIPNLVRFLGADSPVLLAMDADVNPDTSDRVNAALMQLGRLVEKTGAIVSVASWHSRNGTTKGVDDLIANAGIDAWEKASATATPLQEWHLKTRRVSPLTYVNTKGELRMKPASIVAEMLAEAWGEQLVYNAMTESWWEYGAENDGLWTERTDVFIAKTIGETLTNSNVGHGADFPRGIQRLLMARLAIHELKEKRNVIPLRNGILCLDTGDFLDHNPDYHLRWQLPYDYNPMATCHPIEQWLLETQGGDRQRVQLLRAYLKAVVTGRTDLQRFLEIVGPGGTGKSTYANLAISLVGIENCHITELKRLENNRFETANIYGKRLVYITDSERYAGNVSVFKSLTGQDPLPYERKYKHAQSSFYADAMVILCANEPIVSADYTSGLSRRRLTVPFTHRVADKDRRVLLDLKRGEGDFIPYLPGLLNWVIALPDAEMKNLIVNTAESVPSLNDSKNETLLASNPLAEWLDARCVFVPGVRSQVGNAIKERVTKTEGGDTRSWEEYAWVDQWLYPNYRQYCDRSNIKPISLRRFSDLLIDLCQCQLNQEGIEKGRDRDGAFITGIALRSEAYADSPRPVSGEDSEPEAEAVAEVDDESPVEWRILTPPDRQSAETLLHSLKQAANVAEMRRIWFDPSRYSDAARQAVTTHLRSVEWGRSIVDQIFNDF